jgi:abequosyltransferase
MSTIDRPNGKPLLTIAIPTFDRNSILRERIQLLLPQLTDDCELLIIDNASEIPVEDTLADVLQHYPNARIRLVRNRANIGANANIMRCFELSEGPYIWVLSDDDLVLPNAIETIFDTVEHDRASMYFTFSTERLQRSKDFTTHGVDDFVEKMDSFGYALLISNSVFRVKDIWPNLRVGHHYTYSMAPHLALLMMSLHSAGQCAFSTRRIVSMVPPRADQQWPSIRWGLGIMMLLELPMAAHSRQLLAKKILQSSPPLEWLVTQLLATSVRDHNTQSARYQFDQIVSRFWYFRKGIMPKAKLHLYRLMLRFPNESISLITSVRQFLRRGNKPISTQDLYQRL